MSWQEYATLGVEVTLDIDKARRELGYAPMLSREAGLAEISENSLYAFESIDGVAVTGGDMLLGPSDCPIA